MDKPLSLHIGIAFGKGGEGRVVSELRRTLPQAGFRFAGLVGSPDNVSDLTSGEVTNFAPQNASLPSRLWGARRHIALALKRSPAIVASHFALYTAPALDLLKGQRMVTHFHGPWAMESVQEGSRGTTAQIKSRLERTVYQRSDRVIVLSKSFGKLAQSSFGVDPERIRLVPGSVDVERFALSASRTESRELLSLPTDRPILVSVRRLVQRMGLTSLLDAMQEVAAAIPEVLLCIGGQGALKAQLEQQVDRMGLQRNVRFLGFVPEEHLPHLYRAADINVVPTLALEGFGLVAAEALAAGTPSMVTPVGGLPEVVAELSPDLIFASPSAEDIAYGLREALRGGIALPSRGACQAFAMSHFRSERMAEQTAAVYRELLH